MRHAVVAGAGVAGLSAALLLRRRGWDVELFEASDGPGGLLRPVRFRGIDCDLGSHRLHLDALTEPLLAEIAAGVGLERRPRRGRIVFGGRHLPYPLALPSLLAGLGPRRAMSFAGSWLRRPARLSAWDRERLTDQGDVGFEAFVVARAGRAAYESFYRPYAEKVWGLEPAQVSQSAAKARVSTARPWQQIAALAGSRSAKTFLYPRRGMASLVKALHSRAVKAGVRLLWSNPAPRDADADAVLHSGPLRDLCGSAATQHRGLYLVFLALAGPPLHDAETYYTPEAGCWFGRVGVVGNYTESQRVPGETALCLEIPEGRWGKGAEFVASADQLVDQLVRAGIVDRRARVLAAEQRFVPDVYPLHQRGWRDDWRKGLDSVARHGRVLPIGRQGLHLHCNIDHAMAVARAAVEHLDAGGTAATWPRVAERFAGLTVRD
jgi:hypothetical protein